MKIVPLLLLINSVICVPLMAGEVEIVAAAVHRQGLTWQVDVTLRHPDSGWAHYADRWRIVDSQGRILGERILYHPHVQEQPFTRSLNSVALPETIRWVDIEAHDTVHGWASARLRVTLDSR